MHGQFIWYELTTPDPDGAKRFYSRLMKWGTQAFDADYTLWTSDGVPVAGLFRLTSEMHQQGVPPNWMPYIEANDVDATAARAESLGGSVIVNPADIPGVGRFAVVRDPDGAAFGIYTSSNMAGAYDGTPVVGRPSWHELMSNDAARSFEFYRGLFGWEKTGEMDMGGGNMYTMFGQTVPFGGMFTMGPEMAGMHPFWLVYLHVKDVGRAVAAAVQGGATVIRPQMDIPGGSIAILSDPQGAGIALHHDNPVEAPAGTPTAKARTARSKPKTTAKSKKGSTKSKVRGKSPARAAAKTKARAAKKAGTRTKARPQTKAKKKASSVRKAKPAARKKQATRRPRAKAKK